MKLTELFLEHAGAPPDPFGGPGELEAVLEGLCAAGREAWPDIELPSEVFVRHVAETLAADGPTEPLAVLRTTAAGDLYLACACARGDARALAELERLYIARLPPQLVSSGDPEGFLEEIKQVLRVRLLVASEGGRPRIAGYTGRGPLGAWVRISAGRVALNLRHTHQKARPAKGEVPEIHGSIPDAELVFLRSRYGQEFREALEATLAAVTPRDGTLLRLYYLEGVSAEAMGVMYGVDKRSVLRWIAGIRRSIVAGVRRALTARLQVSGSNTQLDGLMDLLHRDIGASILLFLRRKDE